MKTLAYASWLVTAAVAAWYLVQGGSDPHPLIPALLGLSLGAGFAFMTAHGVSEGEIRARSRKLKKAETPRGFWAVVGLRYALSGLLVGGGLWYLIAR